MKTVTLLQHLVDDYTRFVKELPEDMSERGAYLKRNEASHGVCWLIENVYILNYEKYWILRHYRNDDVYWITKPYNFLNYEKSLYTFQYRLNILKAELAHHKKWGWFARFFKPTVVGN